MEKSFSEAFRIGWMRQSIEPIYKQVRAEMELRYIDEVAYLKREVTSLQAQVEALRDRAMECRDKMDKAMGARSPEAPFVWLGARVKLWIFDRRLDRLNKDLEEVESRESSLRDRIEEETTRMEVLILLEYEKGKHLRRMTGMNSINQEGTYDVLGIS